MKKLLAICFLLTAFLFSCEEKGEAKLVNTPEKDGSIEVTFSVNHNKEKNFDVLKTKKIIWVKGSSNNVIVTYDTLKSLGTIKDTLENENGDIKIEDIQKDYKFFITVN